MTLKTMSDLVAYVDRAAQQYRPEGVDVVTETDQATVYMGFPSEEDIPEETRSTLVDVFFTKVQVDPTRDGGQEWSALQLAEAILSNPVGDWVNMDEETWKGGPSFIQIGQWIGSQDLALKLLAVGEYHGLWKVVTPKTLGAEGDLAQRLAGQGLVMASGFKNPLTATADNN